jgi:hypothetical protein
MKNSGSLAVFLIFVCSTITLAQGATSESALTTFIKFSRSQPQTFNSKGVEIRKRYFTDSLYKLFLNELKRQNEYLKKNPTDMPFFGDGVPFQPIDETCEAGKRSFHYTYTVGESSTTGESATVPINFVYPKGCNIPPIVYKFKMVKAKNGWLIDDVDYGDGKALLTDLKRAEY